MYRFKETVQKKIPCDAPRMRIRMKRQMFICGLVIAAIALCLAAAPVTAVILEVTCKGQVSTTNTLKNTLSINFPEQYGCEYPPGKPVACSWKPMSVSSLTGTVPDAAAFTVFKGGETGVATSIGGQGETWITLARLYGARPNEEFVTDIVGDPRTIPVPLIGNYGLDTETVPDCTACTGTVCPASQAKVTVTSSGSKVFDQTLSPGGSFTYNGRNDGSSVTAKFVKGEAAAQLCPGKGGMTGPQPVSVYVISVVPPVGYGQVNLRTASTTRPDEALTPLLTAAAPAASQTPAPTPTRSGYGLPLAVIGALAVIAFFRNGTRR
jgi:hypothetical protein